jgi:hypothetical protein
MAMRIRCKRFSGRALDGIDDDDETGKPAIDPGEQNGCALAA